MRTAFDAYPFLNFSTKALTSTILTPWRCLMFRRCGLRETCNIHYSPEGPFIIIMAADPEPGGGIIVHDADSSVSERPPD